MLVRITRDAALRARLGAAAAEHVRSHFSVHRVANDLLELYATARAARYPTDFERAAHPIHGLAARRPWRTPAACARPRTVGHSSVASLQNVHQLRKPAAPRVLFLGLGYAGQSQWSMFPDGLIGESILRLSREAGGR